VSEKQNNLVTSPPWKTGTRLMSALLLAVLLGLLIYRLRALLFPLMLSGLLAFILHPLVVLLSERTKLSRRGAVVLVYLVVILLLAGATTGVGLAITQQLTNLVQELSALARDLPTYLDRLAELRFSIGPWTVDLSQINLEPLMQGLGSALRPFLLETGALFGSLLGATASVVTMAVAMMVLGYYLLLDSGRFGAALLGLIPKAYQEDLRHLVARTGRVWGAFLRGQLVLSLVVGAVVAAITGALGVRLALVLGVIAGLMEFVPTFGPIIAGAISALVCLFQGSAYWTDSPLILAAVVLAAFAIVMQIEQSVLVPRILGHSLNLHPMVVLLAVLAGGMLGGLLGLLLAAPIVATLRLWVGYVYGKTVGLETWPAPVLAPPRKKTPRLKVRLPKRRSKKQRGEEEEGA
jgi:predicted PurR-regulated permease PerM